MNYAKNILLTDLKRQRAIYDHYSPTSKEGNTMNGKQMRKESEEKIKDLEKTIKSIDGKSQMPLFV